MSTDDQVLNGGGMPAQGDAIAAEVARRGWDLLELVEDPGFSAKTLRRPGIMRALEMLDRGDAEVLMAARLDRLSRSVLDFASIMQRSQRAGWRLVVLDVNVDTAKPSGQLLVNVMVAFAEYERLLIGARTREALAAKRSQGVVLGRRRGVPVEVAARIAADFAAGRSVSSIATALTAEGVPTGQGGRRWWPSTVRAVLAYS